MTGPSKLRILYSVLPAAVLACGPIVTPSSETSDGSGSSTTDQGESTANTLSTTTTPDPSTTSTTTGVDSTEETGVLFLVPPDYVCLEDDDSWHCSFECSPFVQDCPPGEKCMPWANDGGTAWNAFRCTPVDEQPVGWGETCTMMGSPTSGIDDCELGAMCWSVDPRTLQGTCVPQCADDASNPLCPEGTACFMAFDASITLCLSPCDPLVSDCGPDEVCAPDQTGFAFGCVRAVASEGAGAACDRLDACAPDLVCLDAAVVAPACDGVGCCTPWCDLSAPDPSAGCFDPMQQCLPWFVEAPPGYENLGVCAIPA